MSVDIPPDVTVKSKKGPLKVTFDLELVTHGEYDQFRQGKLGPEKDDELLARVSGLPVATLQGLTQLEYRRLLKAFFKKVLAPLDDPS